MAWAYYNEFDPHAAEWLRGLITRGLIAPGYVDNRSIEDVSPDDLREFTQCHFFAGIGVWSFALRSVGWPDSAPIWTGSCPCQPFSAAGKGDGFADERHLWPTWYWLIQQCRPAIVAGEQVASKNAEVWVDLVHADLETLDYAFGCVPFPAAGIGAPHIRDRNYWVAYSIGERFNQGRSGVAAEKRDGAPRDGAIGRLAMSTGQGLEGPTECGAARSGSEGATIERIGGIGRPADHTQRGLGVLGGPVVEGQVRHVDFGSDASGDPGPTNGFWRDVDWLGCRDGKWRPVEPGTFPLVDGAAFRLDSGGTFEGKSRQGLLKGAGNAIVAPAAMAFILSAVEAIGDLARLELVSDEDLI